MNLLNLGRVFSISANLFFIILYSRKLILRLAIKKKISYNLKTRVIMRILLLRQKKVGGEILIST